MVVEFLTHPLTMMVGASVAVMSAANAWDTAIDKRNSKTYQKEWGLYDLELWHSLWTHPETSTTFYRWVDGVWKEQDLSDVVMNLVGWFDRDREIRKQFAEELGIEEGGAFWSVDEMHKIAEYGIWNAVERLDKLSDNTACTCKQCRHAHRT